MNHIEDLKSGKAVGYRREHTTGKRLHSRFNWTIFDPQAKQEHHDKAFPEDLKKAFKLGAKMVKEAW